jgi:hypothetical protein
MTTKANYMPNTEAPAAPKPVNIRYTPRIKVIHSNIPALFMDAEKKAAALKTSGIDRTALANAMGVTPERLARVLSGTEPTLSEAVAYARYFGIELCKTFKPIKRK